MQDYQDLLQYAEAQRRRDAGLDLVEGNYPDYLSRARVAARAVAIREGEVTINEVRQRVGPPPEGVHPNVMGAVFRGREWSLIGYTPATHAAGHARRVGIYVLNTAEKEGTTNGR
jgi:hypothetical protein